MIITMNRTRLTRRRYRSSYHLNYPVPSFIVRQLFQRRHGLRLRRAVRLQLSASLIIVRLFMFRVVRLSVLHLD